MSGETRFGRGRNTPPPFIPDDLTLSGESGLASSYRLPAVVRRSYRSYTRYFPSVKFVLISTSLGYMTSLSLYVDFELLLHDSSYGAASFILGLKRLIANIELF